MLALAKDTRNSIGMAEIGVDWQALSGEIRAEMARRRLTARELSGVLHLGRSQTLKRYEGLMPYRLDEVYAIASWLQVPVAQLLPVEEKVS